MKQTLAYRMRPQHLSDILGQEHLVKENSILNQKPSSYVYDSIWSTWLWQNNYRYLSSQ